MIVALFFSTFAEGVITPRTSLQVSTLAPWRGLTWLVPLVFAGNVVVATLAWIIVGLVMR
jgi:hypothetical protein